MKKKSKNHARKIGFRINVAFFLLISSVIWLAYLTNIKHPAESSSIIEDIAVMLYAVILLGSASYLGYWVPYYVSLPPHRKRRKITKESKFGK
jgi:hypothetical protein